MAKKLHLDIETFSSEPIKTAGLYKYIQSVDFEIMLIAYAFDWEPVQVIDLTAGERIPDRVIRAFGDKTIIKCAHNAAFERNAFKAYGYDIPAEQWLCTMVRALYFGLPKSLEKISEVLRLEEKGKLSTGKALIKYFCVPCTPPKKQPDKYRNTQKDDPTKWQEFKKYCKFDVVSERELDSLLDPYEFPATEHDNYILDQRINDRGVWVDPVLVRNIIAIDKQFRSEVTQRVKDLTAIDNPNSPEQLKAWLSNATGKCINTLAKEKVNELLKELPGTVLEKKTEVKTVLESRLLLSKTSVKKYQAMANCRCYDSKVHGLLQFYGANRTGRWAGQIVQLHNLPQNHMPDLALAREIMRKGDYDLALLMYDSLPNVLSELIRTAFIPTPGNIFAVADFSAIEARVLSYIAGEKWRLDVFRGHGKIYEASAAMMFGVPIESVTKGSEMRQKGKIAELALGYQGALGAMKKMGGEKMGLIDSEMKSIVRRWRDKNKAIVQAWYDVQNAAIRAVKTKKAVSWRGFVFDCDDKVFTIRLLSGRKLYYRDPRIGVNNFGSESLTYMGMGTDQGQTSKKWMRLETYGGKLIENMVQAVSRDILAYAMMRLDKAGYDIVMHIHDEAVNDIPEEGSRDSLTKICNLMSEEVPWAPGLPLKADGYLTKFYKKEG